MTTRQYFGERYVAQQARKTARAADQAYLTTSITRWQTGGNVSFDVPVVQPYQRPDPVDCRAADTPLPGASAVAAVGAPLYALVHYCRAAGLPEPVPEFVFHPTRRWRFDFAFPLHKIAVEVDGGVWTQGRHTRGSGYIADMEKMNAAAKLGWRVLKYTPQTLGVAIDDLRVVLV